MGGVILLVEDEILVRIDVADELRQTGYDVVEADSADAARVILEQRSDVGLVCTDVRMPGRTNGLELVRWIKDHRPTVPVIVVSGERTGRDLPSIADVTMTKPVNFPVLLANISKLLRHK